MGNVLLERSYYIRLGREGRDPLAEFAVIATKRHVAVCGVIRCEVARGPRFQSDLKRFQEAWELMLTVPTDNRLWVKAERLLWQLDRKGQPIPLPDAVIACCALRIGAVLLTFDRHFDLVPGLTAVDRLV